MRPEKTAKSSPSYKWMKKDKGSIFEFHIPFTRRASKDDEGPQGLIRRDTERDPRRFTANYPEESAVPRRPSRRSSYQELRPGSSRIFVTPQTPQQRVPTADLPPEILRRQQASQPSRPAKERAPATDRVPLRRPERTPPTPPVEVHNSRYPEDSPPLTAMRDHYRQRKPPTPKRVRFAPDVEGGGDSRDTTDNNRSCEGQRNRHTEEDIRRDAQFSKGGVGECKHSELGRNRFQRFMERKFWPRSSGPQRTVPRQPRIVQDGNRQITEAGDRIIAQARERLQREEFARDFHERPSRRSLDDQHHRPRPARRATFPGNDRIVYDGGYGHPDWRWL